MYYYFIFILSSVRHGTQGNVTRPIPDYQEKTMPFSWANARSSSSGTSAI